VNRESFTQHLWEGKENLKKTFANTAGNIPQTKPAAGMPQALIPTIKEEDRNATSSKYKFGCHIGVVQSKSS